MHLDAVGFAGAARFLGIDARGREVLTFIAGEVAGRARLVRSYDDAVAAWGIPESAADLQLRAPVGMPTSIAGPVELIGHLDVTPENVVFRDGVAVALIDLDLLRPATRTEEVSNVLLWWAPLMPAGDREPVLRDEQELRAAIA